MLELNYAGSAPISMDVYNEMDSVNRFCVAHGGYALDSDPRVARAYKVVSESIGCSESQIAFTTSCTDAYKIAILALSRGGRLKGRTVLVSPCEYGSNLSILEDLESESESSTSTSTSTSDSSRGIHVEAIPSLDGSPGYCDVQKLKTRLMSDKGCEIGLISISHIPSNSGMIQPVEEIGELIARANADRSDAQRILYIVDACQSFGQLKLDVSKMRCDFMVATSRKFMKGPRGVGFLYVLSPPSFEPHMGDLRATRVIHGKKQKMFPTSAKRYEQWEKNWSAIFGFAVAVDAFVRDQDKIVSAIQTAAKNMRSYLRKLPFVVLTDPETVPLGGIVTFTVTFASTRKVKEFLLENGVVVWCCDTATSPLQPGIRDVVRVSVHACTTKADCAKVAEILGRLKECV